MKTGIELIAIERQEQIEKHKFDIASDMFFNSDRELTMAAEALMQVAPYLDEFPPKWDRHIVNKMMSKSYKERLIIAGALIAAEIDRLNHE